MFRKVNEIVEVCALDEH